MLLFTLCVGLSSCDDGTSNRSVETVNGDSIINGSIDTAIGEIQVNKMDTVFELDYSGQGLTEVPDLSEYPYLKRLDLSHNLIQLKDFEEFSKLCYRNISGGQYELSKLEYLDLSYNQIGRFEYPFKISYLNAIKHLDLSHNRIEYFWPEMNDEHRLDYLNLSDNRLKIISIDQYIDTLDLSNNDRLRGKQRLVRDKVSHLDLEGINSTRVEFIDGIIFKINTGWSYIYDGLSEAQVDSIDRLEHYRDILEEHLELKDPNTRYPLDILEEMVEYEDSYHWSIDKGTVHSSPDNKLRIFSFVGETVGAYSNPFWKTIIDGVYYQKRKDLDFGAIDRIHQLPDNKYLVIHQNHGRAASVYSERRMYADVISIHEDEIRTHSIKTPRYPWRDEHSHKEWNRIELVNGSDSETNELNMRYEPSDSTLSYAFSNGLNWCCAIDSTKTYAGFYKYIDGQMIHQTEKITTIENSHE